jgi:outer membrane protein assembly factor BamB
MKKRFARGASALTILVLALLPLATCQKAPAPQPANPSPSQQAPAVAQPAPVQPAAVKPAPVQQAASKAATPAAQPARQPVGRAVITFLSGEVSMKTSGDWQPAEIGTGLTEAASLKTGTESLCELQLGSTALVRIAENTVVALNELTLEPRKSQVSIGMIVGTVVCKVNALTTGERFQVSTPSAVCGVRGTEFVVNINDQNQLLLGVQKGQVAVLPPWADFRVLRAELKEKADVIDPLVDQVNETARVVKENQQIVVRAATVRAWQKVFAPIEDKVNALSARAKKGEDITKDDVTAISTSLEPLETSLAKPLESSTALAAATTTILTQTANMRFREIPEAAALPSASSNTQAAPAPAAAGLVTITVTAQPSDAEILMNGSLAGKGECSGLFAPGEKVTFLARRSGYVDKTLEVTAEKGAPRTYGIDLEKTKEEVNIRVTPTDAQILLAGAVVGKGSYTGQFAPGDKLSFTAHREGYADTTVAIDVVARGGNSRQMNLEELREGVSIRTTPADAEILLNGKTVGRGSFTQGFKVGEGITFLIRADGYEDKTLSITVAKGAAKEYSVQLDAKPLVRRFTLSRKSIVGRIALFEGRVFAADATGTLYAAGLKGEAAWSLATKNTPNETSAPLLLGSRLYFTGASEFIIAEPATGTIDYRGDLDTASAHQFGQRVARLDQYGMFPVASGVRLFDLGTGAATREIPVPAGSMMTPVAWNGKIVTVSQEGLLVVIDPSSGDILSQISTKAIQPVAVSVQVREDRGYFADRKGLVVCLDLAAAKVLWQVPLVARQSVGVFQDLEAGPEGVFAYGKGSLYGLSLARGEPLFTPLSGVSCPPLYRDGRLFFGTDQGSLRIADAATGKILGSLDVKTKITSRPEWLEGLLYLGSAGGEIIVVNPAAIR